MSETLTFDALSQWSKEHPDNFILKGKPGYVRIMWPIMSESPDLVNNFLKFPYELQCDVLAALIDRNDARLVGAYYRLARELTIKFPSKLSQSWPIDAGHIRKFATTTPQTNSTKMNETLSDCTEKFEESCKEGLVPYFGLTLFRDTLLMVKALHGEDKTISVMEVYLDSDDNVDLDSLVRLAERWDEFSDYPSKWALAVVDLPTDD